MPLYVPSGGDFVNLHFDPQAGREQKGHRPALVVSADLFNRRTGLAIVCPLTNSVRNYPFHLPVPTGSVLTGFVMVEQAKSVDYQSRRIRFIEAAEPGFLQDVVELLKACLAG